jgi:hypothetical protein
VTPPAHSNQATRRRRHRDPASPPSVDTATGEVASVPTGQPLCTLPSLPSLDRVAATPHRATSQCLHAFASTLLLCPKQKPRPAAAHPPDRTGGGGRRSSRRRFTRPPDRPGAPQPAALHALCDTRPARRSSTRRFTRPPRPASRSSTATVIGTLPRRCTRAYPQASPFLDSLRRRMCTRVLAHAASTSSLRMSPHVTVCVAAFTHLSPAASANSCRLNLVLARAASCASPHVHICPSPCRHICPSPLVHAPLAHAEAAAIVVTRVTRAQPAEAGRGGRGSVTTNHAMIWHGHDKPCPDLAWPRQTMP